MGEWRRKRPGAFTLPSEVVCYEGLRWSQSVLLCVVPLSQFQFNIHERNEIWLGLDSRKRGFGGGRLPKAWARAINTVMAN